MRPISAIVRGRSTLRGPVVSAAWIVAAFGVARNHVLLGGAIAISLATTAAAQQTSAIRTPASVASTAGSTQLEPRQGATNSPPQYAGESSGLRPSMPTEAWTAAAAKPDANTLPQQMTAVGNGDPYNSSSPSGTESSVQFAGYTATQDEPAPSVYSAGANQRVGSVATVPNAPQPSAAPPKERQRIPIADKTGNAEGGTKSSSTIRPLLSMVFSLLIVLGLFFGMVWLYRKSSNNPSQAVPKQVVQILGRTPMAARQHLVLVRFGSKLLLVSLAQGETRTLGEITDPLEVDQLAGLCESSSPNSLSNSFRNILSQGVQA